jgi:hypothetical protein
MTDDLNCGCDAQFLFAEGGNSAPGATEIVHCSLHKAAGALLEAAETVQDNWKSGDLATAVRQLSAAIKQARDA